MTQAKLRYEINRLEKNLNKNEIELKKLKLFLADFVIKNNLEVAEKQPEVEELFEKISEYEMENINLKTSIQDYKMKYYSSFLQVINDYDMSSKELDFILKIYKLMKEKEVKFDAELLKEIEKIFREK